jgi:lipopolysaccharide export system protein LptC
VTVQPVADPVGLLAPAEEVARRAEALARWRKRSELVHFYRRALPATMAALGVMCVAWIGVRSLIAHFRKAPDVATIHMLHPLYYGRNDEGQPYKMGASLAVKDGVDPDRIALTDPSYTQTTAAPAPEIVTADRGVYNDKTKLLDLYGHVRATDGKDNHFESDFAHVDMNKSDVSGKVPMYAYGPSGTLRAQSYMILNKGQHMYFIGAVHSHLLMTSSTPKTPASAAGPNKSAPIKPVSIKPVPIKQGSAR